jgi:hypothetical protein
VSKDELDDIIEQYEEGKRELKGLSEELKKDVNSNLNLCSFTP